MPWNYIKLTNYTKLWIPDWQDGKISNERVVTSREVKASVTQPQWGPGGSLLFADDCTGYWEF